MVFSTTEVCNGVGGIKLSGPRVYVQRLMQLEASVFIVMFCVFKGTFLYISMRKPSVMSSYDQCFRN